MGRRHGGNLSTVPTQATLEFDALAYASALANCSVAGQGIRELRVVLCGAVLLARSTPNMMSVCLAAFLASVREGDALWRVCPRWARYLNQITGVI
jgi:hypothetical protein